MSINRNYDCLLGINLVRNYGLYSVFDSLTCFCSVLSYKIDTIVEATMNCTRCSKRVKVQTRHVQLSEYFMPGNIFRLDCNICATFIAVKDNNNDIVAVDEIINDNIDNSWREADTRRERIIYYILCQIIYPELDTPRIDKFESLYDLADPCDKIILKWLGGKAIGFYTIKPKGTEIRVTKEKYEMHTLDTAYIRSQYRNRGFGLELLSDLVRRFPNEDIGFSRPISNVLTRFLSERKECRLHFWEVEGVGDEGRRKLIWFLLKKRISG
ncbi:soluble lamin-associated protein of 75 kDa isoform X2 [Cephus cinctus]|uniref:Soluble lamin-associated protein of 75 kDa isoform X2 n=1 Tax=Cephus cinctus TaxID=211228 RepID=A0AAJ7CEK6_CEPCN|nr:soluble lamin-associated protein of 75 kDa isoform X2 [Cephus cinctus]